MLGFVGFRRWTSPRKHVIRVVQNIIQTTLSPLYIDLSELSVRCIIILPLPHWTAIGTCCSKKRYHGNHGNTHPACRSGTRWATPWFGGASPVAPLPGPPSTEWAQISQWGAPALCGEVVLDSNPHGRRGLHREHVSQDHEVNLIKIV